MRHFIEAIFNSENIRYVISLLIAAILSYSTMWHSVNKNAYDLKSQNKEILSNQKSIDKTAVLIEDMSKDIVEIKIMLAKLESRSEK